MMDPIRDSSIDKTMQEEEITHEEATKHVYDALMPAYTKELIKVCKKYSSKNLENCKTVKRGGRLR